MPAAWAACFQSEMFCSRNARNPSGESDEGKYPPACRAALYFGSSLARFSALLRMATTGFGVLPGASRPDHGSASRNAGAILDISGTERRSATVVDPA